jgi:hypothetical protein
LALAIKLSGQDADASDVSSGLRKGPNEAGTDHRVAALRLPAIYQWPEIAEHEGARAAQS